MGFNCGIVGLPNVGKSTLFNALTAAGAAVANYPFCTIEPNVGVVEVPDDRLDRLAEIFKSKKIVPTTVEFVDIAGLVKGASQGEGLGNKFLSHIRNVDAIVHIVRCFENPDVAHVSGSVDPARDIEIIETELILADLETVERRLQTVEKKVRSGEAKAAEEHAFTQQLHALLAKGEPIRGRPYTPEQMRLLHEVHLLTDKPVLYVANVSEADLGRETDYVRQVRKIAEREAARVIVISGQVEAEVIALPKEDRPAFLKELGLAESGLDRLIQAGYQMLGLITFFTAGEPESRAWTVSQGTKAPQAAGKIHSDMEKGFIRAEVMAYSDLMVCGNATSVRERGLLRVEGRDYVIRDGDILHFRFQV
ncbi:MAG TPA: redox-regulated ATPase YchF [Nitrospiria bacterium]|nr:redox-regulated ATPase YchF [Nitrospiria bacterium]